jgi:hypothetical protein
MRLNETVVSTRKHLSDISSIQNVLKEVDVLSQLLLFFFFITPH